MATSFGWMEIVMMMALGGSGGAAAGVPLSEDPLQAKIAPEECLYYVTWAELTKPDPSSANHTEQMLADPKVQQFIVNTQLSFFSALEMQAGQADERTQQSFSDMKELLKITQGMPGAAYLSELTWQRDQLLDLRGGGIVRVDTDGAKVKELLENLVGRIPDVTVKNVQLGKRSFQRVNVDESAPPLTWGIAGKYLIFGVGDGEVEAVMERARGESPTWLTTASSQLAIPRRSSLAYVNVRQVIEVAMEQVDEPQFEQAISLLGLDNVESYSAVSGFDEEGYVQRSLFALDGPAEGIFSWIDLPPLTAEELQVIDADAPAAVACRLDAAEMVDLWIDLITIVEPRQAEQAMQSFAMFRQQFDVDLREDVLRSLGDSWCIFAHPGGSSLINGWTISVSVDDVQSLDEAMAKLLGVVEAQLGALGEKAPSLTISEVAGFTVYTLEFPQPGVPVKPTWCLTDNSLIVAAMPATMDELLTRESGDSSLASGPAVKPLMSHENCAVAYIDMQQIARTFLPMAQMAMAAANNQRFPLPLNLADLPSAGALIDHLRPTRFALHRTDDGLVSVTHQTLPSANLAAAAPTAVALMLPAVHSARTAARRAQSMNNMKQLALSLHNYHDAHGAFPAGYSSDEQGRPLLSWRVQMLPYLEEAALYNEFRLDEPWDSPHNKELIARMPSLFRSPNSTAEGFKTNYLGVSGADGIFVRPPAGDAKGTSFRRITDGTSKTLMLVEASDELAVVWTKPGDFAPKMDNPMKGLLGLHRGGFLGGMGDGSVRFIADSVDVDILKALFTKSGREAIPNF